MNSQTLLAAAIEACGQEGPCEFGAEIRRSQSPVSITFLQQSAALLEAGKHVHHTWQNKGREHPDRDPHALTSEGKVVSKKVTIIPSYLDKTLVSGPQREVESRAGSIQTWRDSSSHVAVVTGLGGSAPGGAAGASPDGSGTNPARQWCPGTPFGKAKWMPPLASSRSQSQPSSGCWNPRRDEHDQKTSGRQVANQENGSRLGCAQLLSVLSASAPRSNGPPCTSPPVSPCRYKH